MTPEFATTAASVLLDVLDVCDRASRGTAGPPDRERAGLLASFAAASTTMRGARAEEWHLASYALAAVADELLIVDIKWSGADWWENHPVEIELFGTRRRATEFFDRATKAASFPVRDALTVFAAAVSIGFRGILRDDPEKLETWMRANGQTLKLPEGRPVLRSRSVELSGAPPLRSPVTIIWLGLAAVVLALFAVVTAWWAFVVS
jgi:type VI protein secretion system component VasF